MKAVVFRAHGGPEVLEYAESPTPVPSADELLVRVKACSINHLDIWIRQGNPAYKIQLPHISGCDVAGAVERVGSAVTEWKAGDAVVLSPALSCRQCPPCRLGVDNRCVSFGIRGAATNGGYAEFVTAKAADTIRMPSNLSFEQAAAYPLVFLTAWHMLITRAKLQSGESVLVHAGGSGIGHAAIQIAKYVGAFVYTTAGSDEKAAKAKALGASLAINYRQSSFEEQIKNLTQGNGVNVVFEHTGPETWGGSLKVLAKGGRLVMCGATSGPSTTLDLRYVFSRELSILGAMMGTRAEFDAVTSLIAQGKLAPVVDTVFPLREARAAQERMLSRNVFGKLVLAP